MLIPIIIGIIVGIAAVVTGVLLADSASKSKKDADDNFSRDKQCGGTSEPCPLQKGKSLEVRWSREDAYCGDDVTLLGTAKGITSITTGKATVEVKGQGTVASLEAKGQNSFSLPWRTAEVTFSGKKAPAKKPATGHLAADGMNAKTKKALAVKRVPDKKLESVSFNRKSGKYGWTASFRLGVEGDQLNVRQTLQIKKAWLGKWILFDPKLDKATGAQTWGWAKKSGTAWKYWKTSSSSWSKVPRKISQYKLKNMIFVKSGKKFVGRDDGGKSAWPESFSEPKNYASKKKAWLKNIHGVWDDKFKLVRKDCKSKASGCCEWKIDVVVNWSKAKGDKLVYAVWAADWERSNAKDWYLSEQRLGVAGHECGHLLGAYDEYKGGAIDPKSKKIEANSIMGQNLTVGYPRHFDGLRDEAKKKMNSWAGRKWDFEVKKR